MKKLDIWLVEFSGKCPLYIVADNVIHASQLGCQEHGCAIQDVKRVSHTLSSFAEETIEAEVARCAEERKEKL